MSTEKLRNIGPKSSAWLRQVGLRTHGDLSELGAVESFMRVKRAGFKPTLNLLYAIEGALQDCHWQQIPGARRSELVADAEAAIAQLPPPRHKPPATPVTTTVLTADTVAMRPDPDAPYGEGRYWHARSGHADVDTPAK